METIILKLRKVGLFNYIDLKIVYRVVKFKARQGNAFPR